VITKTKQRIKRPLRKNPREVSKLTKREICDRAKDFIPVFLRLIAAFLSFLMFCSNNISKCFSLQIFR